MRQSTVLPLSALIALSLAWPVSAQRASLAERVGALEAHNANAQPNVDLLNQINQLKSEVQSLRAQIEELQQQTEQQKSSGRSQYLDLDARLNRLEGGTQRSSATSASPAAVAIPTTTAPAQAASTMSVEPPPKIIGDRGAVARGQDERAAYETAFDVLKSGRYAEASRAFQQFLEGYPGGYYAPNALYWLGESYYVTQNYALALEQFQTLLQRYPTHDKAAGALLKIGLAQYGLKHLDQAQASFQQVTQRYPGTDAARTAEDRLRAIELTRAQ